MRRIAVVACVAVALTLAGCSSTPYGLAVFDEPQSAADVVPENTALERIDPESTRWLAENNGVDYFAALSAEDEAPRSVCVVLRVQESDAWYAGCSSGGPGVKISTAEAGSASLVGNDFDEADLPGGWIHPHANLIVAD